MRLEPPPRRVQPGAAELVYVAAFVAIEGAGLVHPLAAAIGQAVLLMVLINHYVLGERQGPRPLLLGLAVASLYRLLAFTPLPTNDLANHLVLVGAPTLLGTLLALRLVRDPAPSVGTPRRSIGIQAAIAVVGVPLSEIAYRLLKPGFVVTFSGRNHARPGEVAAVILGLVVFSGVGEELLFRVLIHRAARARFGASALYVSTAIFGAAYLGTRSLPFVLFVVAVGAFFGWCYERTGSIWGVAAAHSIISVGVFVVWPSLAHLPHL